MTAPASLAEALLLLQADLPAVAKRQTARVESAKGGYSYKYAGLSAVSAAILPRLNRLGVVFVARPMLVDGRPVLCCELIHAGTGERMTAEYPIAIAPNAPAQAIGSAISYGRRYCLTAMVGVVAEDDDDGRAASMRPARAASAAPDPNGSLATSQPASETEIRRLQIQLREAGYVERPAKLAFCAAGVGRELASSKELTRGEVALLLTLLDQAADDEHTEDPA